MAEYAHSTPTFFPHVTASTPPASRRRTLFAAAGAVIMGGGITAGAAASVADLLPAKPDAELIRLCGDFINLELQWRAIYDGPAATLDDDEAEAASLGIGDQMNRILAEMEPMRATTADGVLARARALAAENGNFGCSFDHRDTVPGRLLVCLLRDAAAVGGRA